MATSAVEQFAAWIAGLESEGLSRTEIAERAGVSRNTVWRLATGSATMPSHSTVSRIEKIYTSVRHLEQKSR